MNNKKKVIGIISSAAISMTLCACGNGGGLFADPTPTPAPHAEATAVVTMDNVLEIVNGQYTIELDNSSSVQENNVSTAAYRAVPNGAGDPVIVKVIEYTNSISPNQIWDDYENTRISRPASEIIEGIGDDAYIAYPSIHVYDRGCEIVITAGSGSDDGQENTLKQLAQKAVANLETIMPEPNVE